LRVKVQREILVPSDPTEVWAALTEPARLREWFANDVELDPRPGGAGMFRWDDGSVRQARVEAVEEGRRLAFSWSEDDQPATLVEIELEEVDAGTRVRVAESAPQASASTAPLGEWAWAIAILGMLPSLRPVARLAY
jgi:uncharacterized protein YndB with AHSA1/START domain